MQAQTPEVSTEKATTPSFKPGDKVTFAQVRETTRTTHINIKEATIVVLVGESAMVKYRNGQKLMIKQSLLTPAGERNALTKALLRGVL